jgi:trans-aconitate methyltransferase
MLGNSITSLARARMPRTCGKKMPADLQDIVIALNLKANMDWIIPQEESGRAKKVTFSNHPNVVKFLERHKLLFQDKVVLDLACHTGSSTGIISGHGAKRVVGIDIRKDLIEYARDHYKDESIYFFCNDITNYGLVDALVSESNIVTCFGALYHLTDNFTFLEHICKDNIEYVIIETMFGTESPNPFMFPLFEDVTMPLNGYHPKYAKVPICQPNLSWIYQSLLQIGFRIDTIEKYYQSTNFENLRSTFEDNQRMILKFYNPKLVQKTNYLEFDDIWEWNEDTLIQQC